MTALTLGGLQRAYNQTLKAGATPHREPDFELLRKEVDLTAPVTGRLWFIEEHNTGYNGLLFRYQFFMTTKGGEKISTWADLLPDLITERDGDKPQPLIEREPSKRRV